MTANRTLKIGISCALGAFIGSLIALQLGIYTWWIGMVVGGLVGYLGYEFKKVIDTIPIAWNKATKWRPSRQYWVPRLKFWTLGVLIISQSVVIILNVYAWDKLLDSPAMLSVILGLIGVFPVLSVFWLASGYFSQLTEEQWRETIKEVIAVQPLILPFVFAIGVPWCVVVGIRKYAGPFARVLSSALGVIYRFLKHLIVLIHSDERLLCGLDAAIGTAIGYYAGNAFIGAMSGLVFGVLNYEIVSKRILRGPIARTRAGL